jgi:hypothetical protein
LSEKRVEITLEAREVKRSEIWESLEEVREERESWIVDCERGESEMVGYGEKLFADEGE